MIPLLLPAEADGDEPYVARVGRARGEASLTPIFASEGVAVFASPRGLLTIEGAGALDLAGDVLLVDPRAGTTERLIRSGSGHNTLLVTERCDQLCVMCSQPPKKTHNDRLLLLESACLLADPGANLGITGGEPLLYKEQLFGMIERLHVSRPDLSFHVLTNGQHFEPRDLERLAAPAFDAVQWGIPLYSDLADEHDAIVGKTGAFVRLEDSFATLAQAGATIELRTVVLTSNIERLPKLAAYVVKRLPFVTTWSVMQLENIGYARRRWSSLRFDHATDFSALGATIDTASVFGLDIRLFNFARCTVPERYRQIAVASISDWKQRFSIRCGSCREKGACSGFFEWHPTEEIEAKVNPL